MSASISEPGVVNYTFTGGDQDESNVQLQSLESEIKELVANLQGGNTSSGSAGLQGQIQSLEQALASLLPNQSGGQGTAGAATPQTTMSGNGAGSGSVPVAGIGTGPVATGSGTGQSSVQGEISALEQALQELQSISPNDQGTGGLPTSASTSSPGTTSPGAIGTGPVSIGSGTGQSSVQGEISALEQALQELQSILPNDQGTGGLPTSASTSSPGMTSPDAIGTSPISSGSGTTQSGAQPSQGATAGATTTAGTAGAAQANPLTQPEVDGGSQALIQSLQDVVQALMMAIQNQENGGGSTPVPTPVGMDGSGGQPSQSLTSNEAPDAATTVSPNQVNMAPNTATVFAPNALTTDDGGDNSLASNNANLESEIQTAGSQGSAQITSDATKLATEAANDGDTALSAAATYIAASAIGTGDGSYTPTTALTELQSASPAIAA